MRTLTTAEAAARLGVKPETLYAYVSRGLLTSVRGTGGRSSTFDADEVDALVAGRGRRPTGVAETITTRLTLVEGDDVVVRGRRLVDLARTETPERMAALLWLGDLDAELPDAVPDRGPGQHADREVVASVRALVVAMPGDPRPVDRLRLAVAALAPTDPWRFDLGAAVATGLRCWRGMVGALGGLWPALSDRPEEPEVLRTALVLLADHGLAASTLAARVAASTRAHPYAVVSAGLGALDGPVHGTASTAAYRFLAEALHDPARAVAERLRAGEGLPGFGHSIHTGRDPRAAVLLGTIDGSPEAALVSELAGQVEGRPGMFPNVDLALAAVAHAHGMRPDAGEAIFAVARTVGWIAHAIEQYAEPGLRFRITGAYVGTPLSS